MITNVEIKKLGINGEGIGYINRKITFVKGALPQEVVEVEIVEETKNYKIVNLIKVVKASKQRKEPICNLSEFCLGCPLQNLNYEQQLYFKRDIIRDSLERYTELDLKRVDFRKCLPASKTTGYRDIALLPIVRFHIRLKFGIFHRDSKYLTIMNTCQVQDPLINRCLNDLEAILNDNGAHSYNEDTRMGLRFLTLRVFGNKIQLIFVTGRDRLDYRLIEKMEELSYIESIYYTINVAKKDDFTRGRYEKVSGNTRETLKINKQKFIVSPKSDYFVNVSSLDSIIENVSSLLSNSVQSILEINSGVGWLSLNLDSKYQIKGIDFNRSNIDDAKLNARFLRKENCTYEAGKLDELMPTLTKNLNFDAFIIHNNHLGMRQSVKDSIIRGRIKEIIYLSTSPSSFAKDVKDLEKYYHVETIIPVDELPQTQNVKIIAKLVRKDDKKRS